jgi:Transglutaminase-like superfamily
LSALPYFLLTNRARSHSVSDQGRNVWRNSPGAEFPGSRTALCIGMLSVYWLALRCGVWLCSLPLLLRLFSLPVLLRCLTVAKVPRRRQHLPDIDFIVKVVRRIAHLRPFTGRLFPRACLRQSLVLYRILTHGGYPAKIHIGVLKDGAGIGGHSWVTLHGKALGEPIPLAAFSTLYSYPPLADSVQAE